MNNLFKLVLVFVLYITVGCKKNKLSTIEHESSEWLSGGAQTTFVTSSGAYSQGFTGLSGTKSFTHDLGDAEFEKTFNSDPNQANYGLGPIFNSQSCVSCHAGNGGGKAPNAGGTFTSLLLRISIPGNGEHGTPNPVPNFGTQLQQHGTLGTAQESDITISYNEFTYQFFDGESYTLREPLINITNPYTTFDNTAMISPRIALPLIGLGLLEAISATEIINRSDEFDSNGDGVSGKPNFVYDRLSKSTKLGRFGWKASQPSLIQQVASAFLEDIGITSFLFKNETTLGQSQHNFPLKYDLYDSTLYAVAYYMKTLQVPVRRNLTDENVIRGKSLFTSAGCISCHVSKHRTEVNMLSPETSNQVIYPYTDLLLHDMGSGLADNRPDNLATGYEWRTPALWGVGLASIVTGSVNLLHDGRARNFTEAIMWHGGEASNAKQKFESMPKTDRDALRAFLKSL
jgi:CxxC motif-containing protein (DUF1111 family)